MACRIQLSLSCSNLPGSASKMDPICVLQFLEDKEGKEKVWREAGKTEAHAKTVNASFEEKFEVTYRFGLKQPIKVLIYNISGTHGSLEESGLVGSISCELGEVIGSPSNSVTRPLTAKAKERGSMSNLKKDKGSVTVTAHDILDDVGDVELVFGCTGLPKMDLIGSADPYMILYRIVPDGEPLVLWRSEIIKNNRSPIWERFRISLFKLSPSGDLSSQIRIEVYDWDRGTQDDMIGWVEFPVAAMASSSLQLPLLHPEGKSKERGELVLHKYEPHPTFVQFLRGAMEMNLVIGIDFTASNGKPNNPESLHYTANGSKSTYMRAIEAVSSVLLNYDSDKLVPTYGIGAKLWDNEKRTYTPSSCFPLNGNPEHPECAGLEEIIACYNRVVPDVRFYGPTNFAPILHEAMKTARDATKQRHLKYVLLLLLTDGELSDTIETVNAIVEASVLPMSVVIVGVGNANFERMEILDADDHPLRSTDGRVMERDIVQFVPFRQYEDDPDGLAKAVLQELPRQVVEYFERHGVKPPSAA
eukprot:Rmarinus@m.27058